MRKRDYWLRIIAAAHGRAQSCRLIPGQGGLLQVQAGPENDVTAGMFLGLHELLIAEPELLVCGGGFKDFIIFRGTTSSTAYRGV